MAGRKENLLMFGSTGLIGIYILEAIIEKKDAFGRIAIITSPGTANSKAELLEGLKRKGVQVIVGDVTKEEDVLKAYEGIDIVVSAVGRNVLGEQVKWIQLADKSPSIKRFFPSEYGTDIEYFPHSVNEKPHQLKLKVRAALRECKNLEYTYVVTGPYAEGYLNAMHESIEAVGTFVVKQNRAVVIGDGKWKVSLTTMRDVGKLTALAILQPEVSKNRALKVNSFTTTQLDIVAEFEKQTGAKWTVTHVSLEELKAQENEAWEHRHPGATAFTLRRIWAEGGTLYEKRDNEVLGGGDTDSLESTVEDAITRQVRPELVSNPTTRLTQG